MIGLAEGSITDCVAVSISTLEPLLFPQAKIIKAVNTALFPLPRQLISTVKVVCKNVLHI